MSNWIKSIPLVQHITEQPFVFSTGLAALMHSTWSLGMLFAGEPPENMWSWQGAGWLIPAFLIAFALDVGQIYTSYEIRSGQRDYTKYITFMVFALATYYLQWMYCLHHMPELSIAAGISDFHKGNVISLRDMAIWIIPAFLPLSTLLYTFAAHHEEKHVAGDVLQQPTPLTFNAPPSEPMPLPEPEKPQIEWLQPENMLLQPENMGLQPEKEPLQPYLAFCPHCDWTGEYDSEKQGKLALNGHLRFCKSIPVPTNGNGHK